MSESGQIEVERSTLEACAWRFLRAYEANEAQMTETDLVKYFAPAITRLRQSEAALREPFKNADEKDWEYLDRLLLTSIRHQQDDQARFWWSAMKSFRAALTSQSA